MFCQRLFLFFFKKIPYMIYAWNHMLLPYRAVTSFLQLTNQSYRYPILAVSMPSRAVTSFLLCCIFFTFTATGEKVSMPSRAVTSFLQYPFKNLGFMRFQEAVFAGIYQNILTTAVFRAC